MILFFSWMNFYPKWMIPITGKIIMNKLVFSVCEQIAQLIAQEALFCL